MQDFINPSPLLTKKIGDICIPNDLFEFYNRNEEKWIEEFLGEPPKFNSPIGELDHPSVDKNKPII